MMQRVARGVVVVWIPSPRLAALDRVLELLLTRGEIDDVHLSVRRRVGPRDVQQTRRRQLGVGELALDLHILLQAYRRRGDVEDRKSTRLNSSHRTISYAVFCLKKK